MRCHGRVYYLDANGKQPIPATNHSDRVCGQLYPGTDLLEPGIGRVRVDVYRGSVGGSLCPPSSPIQSPISSSGSVSLSSLDDGATYTAFVGITTGDQPACAATDTFVVWTQDTSENPTSVVASPSGDTGSNHHMESIGRQGTRGYIQWHCWRCCVSRREPMA